MSTALRAAPVVGVFGHIIGVVVGRVIEQSLVGQDDIRGIFGAVIAKLNRLQVVYQLDTFSGIDQPNLSFCGGGRQQYLDHTTLHGHFQAQAITDIIEQRNAAGGIKSLNLQVFRIIAAVERKFCRGEIFKVKQTRIPQKDARHGGAVGTAGYGLQSRRVAGFYLSGRNGSLELANTPAGEYCAGQQRVVPAEPVFVRTEAAGIPNAQGGIRTVGKQFFGRKSNWKIDIRICRKSFTVEPGIRYFHADLAFEQRAGVIIPGHRPTKGFFGRQVAQVVGYRRIPQGLSGRLPGEVIHGGVVKKAVPGVQIFLVWVFK